MDKVATDALGNRADSFADVSPNSFSAACQGMNMLAAVELIVYMKKMFGPLQEDLKGGQGKSQNNL